MFLLVLVLVLLFVGSTDVFFVCLLLSFVGGATGVFAEPELTTHVMVPEDEYIVVASDGIWEFMTNQQCLDLITAAPTLEIACATIVAEAYMLWITNEVRTDDITAIICQRKK